MLAVLVSLAAGARPMTFNDLAAFHRGLRVGIRSMEQAAAAEHRAGQCAGRSAHEISTRGHAVSSL
jgi:hypothetical protein